MRKNKFLRLAGGMLLIGGALMLTTACKKEEPQHFSKQQPICILPAIQTRMTNTDFESGDAIGVTLRRRSGSDHLNNCRFTYDGLLFTSSEALWYNDADEAATLTAYHPYASTLPQTFTVQRDQRNGGLSQSDLLFAQSDASPTADPVRLTFAHLLSLIVIETTADDGISIDHITVGGFAPSVAVDLTQGTVTSVTGSAAEITAREEQANTRYRIILPPQSATMQVNAETSAGLKTVSVPDVKLLSGKYYTLQLKISAESECCEVQLTGEIGDWEQGGLLGEGGGSDQSQENPETPQTPEEEKKTTLEYGGVQYRTQTVAGQEWMAENLRYVPAGKSLGTDYFYPSETGEAPADEKLGLLYTYATATAGDPTKGICPEGWRLPSIDELKALNEAVDRSFFTDSGYVNRANGNRYIADRSLLASTTAGDEAGYVYYLRYFHDQNSYESPSMPQENVASSVRCVKAK